MVCSRSWYIAQCQTHLSDTSVYSKLFPAAAKNLMEQAAHRIRAFADNFSSAAPRTAAYLSQACNGKIWQRKWQFPSFYLLIKLHKNPASVRPIVANHSSLLKEISTWLDTITRPLLALMTSVLRDSFSLLADLRLSSWPRSLTFVTADVSSMYQMMKHNDTIAAISWFFDLHIDLGNVQRWTHDAALRAVKIILEFNVLLFNGEHFRQRSGTPMGTQSGPALADIYGLRYIDYPLLERFGNRILFYRRLIDDILVLCDSPQTASEVQVFLAALKPDSLRFSVNTSPQAIDFLDVHIAKEPGFSASGRIFTAIHEKAVSRFLYLPFRSFHPTHCFSGLVVGELTRAARLCSRPQDFIAFRLRLFDRLRARGYLSDFLIHWMSTVQWSTRDRFKAAKPAHTHNAPLVFKIPWNPATAHVPWRKLLTAHWSLLCDSPSSLAFSSPPTTCWTLGKRLGNFFLTSSL